MTIFLFFSMQMEAGDFEPLEMFRRPQMWWFWLGGLDLNGSLVLVGGKWEPPP